MPVHAVHLHKFTSNKRDELANTNLLLVCPADLAKKRAIHDEGGYFLVALFKKYIDGSFEGWEYI